ncbi:MAG: transpeptidase family protein [Prevotellaceae bacterium]|nr:transpeptidase family protein [Prevotellaceae bacterium]
MKTFPYKQVIKRYTIIAGIGVLLGIFIIGKAAYIMFVERDFWAAKAEECVFDSIPIQVNRGDIISADGQLLATYVPEYKIYLDYNVYEKDSVRRAKFQIEKDSIFLSKVDSLSVGLNKILPDKSVAWFHNRLMEGFKRRSHYWLVYPYRISYFDFKAIKELPLMKERRAISGLHAEVLNKIDKPFGSLAARTLGDVEGSSGRGISGLQKQFDSLLSGEAGLAHKVKTMNKYIPIIDKQPVVGANIYTTIDVNLQDYCENALVNKLKEVDAMYGVAILMEVETGDIKAIVNMKRGNDGVYRDVQNLAASQLMQPGSVFKTISLTAAIEAGKIKITDSVDCTTGSVTVGGYNIRDASHKSAKVIKVPEVLGYSSNVGVIKLITKAYGGNKESEQKFCDDVMKLGIAEDMQLDIPGYERARIPSPKSMGEYWSASSMASMSIGYSTMVPPLSLAAFYNGIANGGRMMRPRIVTHITRNGDVIENIPPRAIKERMCSPQTVSDITKCLRWVVSNGLGGKASSPYFSVAGKTGTARVQEAGHTGEYLVTFAGFFPVEKPKYTCVVCLRKAGTASGGGMCGPVFKQIAEYAMAQDKKATILENVDTLHNIAPSLDFTNLHYTNRLLSKFNVVIPNSWNNNDNKYAVGKVHVNNKHAQIQTEQIDDDIVPNLTGMGLRDALFFLEKRHLKVKVKGVGKITEQSLPSGHKIRPNETIILTLGTTNSAAKHKHDETKPTTEQIVATENSGQHGN